jgi:hypothetical protein
MQCADMVFGIQTTGYTRLVGHDEDQEAALVQPFYRLDGAGDPADLIGSMCKAEILV